MRNYRRAGVGEPVSRRIVIDVNLVKFSIFAVLTVPVAAGVSQRASELGEQAGDTADIVALVVTVGALAAIVGALSMAAWVDRGHRTLPRQWAVAAGSALVGAVGLVGLAQAQSRVAMAVGWGVAQFGYAGAAAVAASILARASVTHRRRGALLVVLGSYAGPVLPMMLLALFPTRLWWVTLAFSLLVVALTMRPAVRSTGEVGGTLAAAAPATHAPVRAIGLSKASVLTLKFCANAVVVVFLAFQPLELADRVQGGSADVARLSVWVLGSALVGLLSAVVVLLRWPALLGGIRRSLILAGAGLTVSLVLRALTDATPLLVLASLAGGVAIGVTSPSLLAAALDVARTRAGTGFMGTFAAAGTLGHLVAPSAGLLVMRWSEKLGLGELLSRGQYRVLLLALAVIPLGWSAWLAATGDRRDKTSG
jgi:hypothetical protein